MGEYGARKMIFNVVSQVRKREARVIWLKMDLLFIDTRTDGRQADAVRRVSCVIWSAKRNKKKKKGGRGTIKKSSELQWYLFSSVSQTPIIRNPRTRQKAACRNFSTPVSLSLFLPIIISKPPVSARSWCDTGYHCTAVERDIVLITRLNAKHRRNGFGIGNWIALNVSFYLAEYIFTRFCVSRVTVYDSFY